MQIKSVIYSVLLLFIGLSVSWAEEKGGDLRSAVQNPISSLISLPFKFNFDYGAPNGEASFLNIQPVDRTVGGRRGQAVQDRQPGHEFQNRGLLQCRKT